MWAVMSCLPEPRAPSPPVERSEVGSGSVADSPDPQARPDDGVPSAAEVPWIPVEGSMPPAAPPPGDYSAGQAWQPGAGQPWADPWQPGYVPGPIERQPGTDGFAVTAFVLALLSFVPFAIGFAIAGLRRIRRTHKGGQGLAIASLVICGLWVVVAIAVAAAHAQPTAAVRGTSAVPSSTATGGIVSAGQIDASQVRVGDCVEAPSGDQVSTLEAVPCSTAHDDEAYFIGQIAASSTYPGDKAVSDDADSICSTAFQSFVGTSIDQSSLAVDYLYPSSDQWSAGDYSVTCFVSTGSKSTGSLRNSRR